MCLFQYNEFFRQVIGLLKQSLAKKKKRKKRKKTKTKTKTLLILAPLLFFGRSI